VEEEESGRLAPTDWTTGRDAPAPFWLEKLFSGGEITIPGNAVSVDGLTANPPYIAPEFKRIGSESVQDWGSQ
jgi:hypothetical protein